MAETYDAAVFGSVWARRMPPGHCCFEASTEPMCALYLIMAHLREVYIYAIEDVAAMAWRYRCSTARRRRDATTSDAAAPRDEVLGVLLPRQFFKQFSQLPERAF